MHHKGRKTGGFATACAIGLGVLITNSFVAKGDEDVIVQPPEAIQLKAWCEPVDGNAVWNAGQRVLHTFVDSPVSMTFAIHGAAVTSPVHNATLVLDVPEGVSIPEAFVSWDLSNGAVDNLLEMPRTTDILRAGTHYRRYDYPLDSLLAVPGVAWASFKYVTVCFDTAVARDSADVFYRFEQAGVAGAEQKVLVKWLPPLASVALPKRFKGSMFTQAIDLNWHSPDLLSRVLHRFEAANIASRAPALGRAEQAAQVDGIMRERGWRLASSFHVDPLMVPASWMGKDVTLRHATGPDGRPFSPEQLDGMGEGLDRLLCPHYVLYDDAFRAAFRELADLHHLMPVQNGETIWIDIEPYKTPETACFCKDCLTDFATKAGISAESVIDPQVVLSTYRREWARYQVFVETESIGLCASLLRELRPASRIGIYDYFLPYDNEDEVERFLSGCRLDPRQLDRVVDIHGLSFYSLQGKLGMDRVDLNVRTLKQDVWVYPSIARYIGTESGYTSLENTLSPAEFRAKLLGAAASGAKGMVIYPGEYIDGGFFQTTQRAMSEIAVVEPYYFDGARRDQDITVTVSNMSDGDKHVGLRVHQLGTEQLVTIINFRPDRSAQLALACREMPNTFTVYDPIAKTVLALDGKVAWTQERFNQEFRCQVASMDARFLVLRPYAKTDEDLPRTDLAAERGDTSGGDDLLEKLAIKKAELQARLSGLSLERRSLHNVTIAPDGEDIVVESPLQRVRIAPSRGGRIVAWASKPDGLLVGAPTEHWSAEVRDLGWDLFWLPKSWQWKNVLDAAYSAVSASLADEGVAMVSLGILREQEELYLEKTYRISETRNAVEIQYTIVNLADRAQTFSFWARHCPTLGRDPNGARHLTFQVPTPQGLSLPVPAGGGDCVFVAPGVDVEQTGFDSASIKGVAIKGSVKVTSAADTHTLQADVELDKLLQFYFFVGDDVSTLEWMYKPVTLAPLEEWTTHLTLRIENP